MVGKCLVCGKEFRNKRKALLCSDECRVEYRKRKAAARAAEVKKLAKCQICGKEFQRQGKLSLCSDQCRAEYYKRKAEKQAAEVKKLVFKPRMCPDCGKPTTDYRCPKCWAKRRVAQGIPISGEGAGYSEYDI